MTLMKTLTALALTASAIACSAALSASAANAEDTQLTIAMITHAQPGDTFWDIIRKGAERGRKEGQCEADLPSRPDRRQGSATHQ